MEDHMAEAARKLPVAENKETPLPLRGREWPFDRLRDEIDSLFDSFRRDSWPNPFRRSSFDMEPLWRQGQSLNSAPAVDIAEKDNAYEITAELPGIDESHLDVQLSNDILMIRGEKEEEKEEEEGLLSLGTPLRLLPTLLPCARRCGLRADRRAVQERRPDGNAAEIRRGAEEREEDRGEGGLAAEMDRAAPRGPAPIVGRAAAIFLGAHEHEEPQQ
jgi:HSP20 family molecular chaperone IbpA